MPPTVTVASAPKLVPLTVIFVPPVVLPCVGDTELTRSVEDGAVGDFEQAATTSTSTDRRIAARWGRSVGRIESNKGLLMLAQSERRESCAGNEIAVAKAPVVVFNHRADVIDPVG